MGVIEQLPQTIVDGNDVNGIDCISGATEISLAIMYAVPRPRAVEGVSSLSAFR